jgi:hypothetical protein
MTNKTCGECRYFNDDFTLCLHWRYEDITNVSGVCNYFAPLTNGDKIRQMSDEELKDVIFGNRCYYCAFKTEDDCCSRPNSKDCPDGIEAWLNAPAESEGEDE